MPSILNHIKRRYSVGSSLCLPDDETHEQQSGCGRGDAAAVGIELPHAFTAGQRNDQHDDGTARDTGPSVSNTASDDMATKCRCCGRMVKLIPYEGDTSMTSPDTGAWYRYACACGHAAFICERDYYRVLR